MENRNFSELSRTQLLDLLERLQGDIDRVHLPLQTDPRLQKPSRLESAVSKRLAELAAQNRLAPHPQLLAAIVEASEDAISSRRLDGTILTWNKGSERIYGYTEQEALGKNHVMLFADSNTAELESINQRLANGETIREHESVRKRKDGSMVRVSLNMSPLMEKGRVVRVCSIARDITARKATEDELQEALARERERAAELAAVLDAVVFIAHDRDCRHMSGNPAAAELLRMPQGGNMSKTAPEAERPKHFRVCRDGEEVPPEDLPVQKAAREGVEVRGYEESIVFTDGTVKYLIGNAKPLRDRSGNVYGAVSAFIDITARRAAEKQIRRMAHFDALTGLPNRSLLMDRLEQALAISQRNHTRTAVVFMDLDHFKEINDRLGHHVGDAVLKQVAERARSCVREVDTVSRLGGDEFIIVLAALRQAGDVITIAQKILSAIAAEYQAGGEKFSVTASLGFSLFPDHGRDPELLIRLADRAMYLAKQAGRNNIQGYHPEPGN
jgi:diguanylate cyclase (GGDEF)-like protein/PAS domain S-box-containing protein